MASVCLISLKIKPVGFKLVFSLYRQPVYWFGALQPGFIVCLPFFIYFFQGNATYKEGYLTELLRCFP